MRESSGPAARPRPGAATSKTSIKAARIHIARSDPIKTIDQGTALAGFGRSACEKLAFSRGQCRQQIPNELILQLKRGGLRQPNGGDADQRAIRNDASEA